MEKGYLDRLIEEARTIELSLDIETLSSELQSEFDPLSEYIELSHYKNILAILIAANMRESPRSSPEEKHKKTRIQAFKLAITFKTIDSVILYLRQFERYSFIERIQDACEFELPESARWGVGLWQKLIVKYMPTDVNHVMLRSFALADKIESHVSTRLDSLNIDTSIETITRYASRLYYSSHSVSLNSNAAEIFFNKNMPRSAFEHYLLLTPHDNIYHIPNIKINGEDISHSYNGYCFVRLNSSDPRVATIGKETDSAYSLDHDEGRQATEYAITHERSGFYIIFDTINKEIIAHIWVWKSKNRSLVLDTIAIQKKYQRENGERMIYDMCIEFADQVMKAPNLHVQRILIGESANQVIPADLHVVAMDTPGKTPYKVSRPVDYDGPRNSFNQVLIAHKTRYPFLIELYKNISTDTKLTKKIEASKVLLLQAASANKWSIVKQLLDNKNITLNINAMDDKCRTTFYFAVAARRWDVLKILLQNDNIMINRKNPQGHSILLSAAKARQWEVVKLLFKEEYK